MACLRGEEARPARQRQRLLRQVARLEDDLRWLDTDLESELVEAGQDEMLARLATQLDEHDRAELAAIDNALERIERGDDGICRACQKPIPSSACAPCRRPTSASRAPVRART